MRRIVLYICRIFSVYKLFLYEVDIETVENTRICNCSKNVEFKLIDINNYHQITSISRELITNVKKMLSYKDYGVFVYVDGNAVGHGWVKEQGSKDAVFSFINSAYLCRFFVHPNYRGMNLYPMTIKYLINAFKHKYSKFYIAIEHKNKASIKGAMKIGFKQVRDITFVRILKCTLNKYRIVNQ